MLFVSGTLLAGWSVHCTKYVDGKNTCLKVDVNILFCMLLMLANGYNSHKACEFLDFCLYYKGKSIAMQSSDHKYFFFFFFFPCQLRI